MGSPELTLGFGLIGFETFPAATGADLEKLLDELVEHREQALLLLEPELARCGSQALDRVRGSGGQVWSYRYSEQQTRDTGTLARIAGFVARIFGAPFIRPPVNVRTRTTTRYSLDVEFDVEGRVVDYEYSRQTDPERSVY